jgi:hypothetical protein
VTAVDRRAGRAGVRKTGWLFVGVAALCVLVCAPRSALAQACQELSDELEERDRRLARDNEELRTDTIDSAYKGALDLPLTPREIEKKAEEMRKQIEAMKKRAEEEYEAFERFTAELDDCVVNGPPGCLMAMAGGKVTQAGEAFTDAAIAAKEALDRLPDEAKKRAMEMLKDAAQKKALGKHAESVEKVNEVEGVYQGQVKQGADDVEKYSNKFLQCEKEAQRHAEHPSNFDAGGVVANIAPLPPPPPAPKTIDDDEEEEAPGVLDPYAGDVDRTRNTVRRNNSNSPFGLGLSNDFGGAPCQAGAGTGGVQSIDASKLMEEARKMLADA